MRSFALTLTTLFLIACGSDSPTDTPPVVIVPVPAVVSVTAGDGQQGVPGANVPVKPVVTVKDAAGRPTPGISVAFAIDSGGGTLQAGSATTASDGTASPGNWTLGPNEARNVLRVTAGSLAPVKLVAIAATASVTIADQTVGPGGGTIAVTTAGSPIDGLKIVVPAGAYAGGQTVGITYGSALGVTLPAGVRILSPLVTFRTSDGGVAASPMQIKIPATVPAGSQPLILLRDAASGRQEIMTTVDWSATSVTGMSSHLNGALLMGADGSVSARSSARREAPAFAVAGGTGTAVVITLPEEMLALDHDTGFRPGVDSWEFRPIGTVYATNIQIGMIASEAWYYVAKKGSSGSLWKKYQEASGIEESNRRGLRWASVAQGEVGAQVGDGILAVSRVSWSLPFSGRPLFTKGNFDSVRGALTLAPGSPQPAILESFDEAVAPVMILVYRSTGKQLFAVDPGAPDQTVVLDFSSASGSMTPVRLSGGGPEYTNFIGAGFSLLASMAPLQAEWAAVADGTIGNDVFPEFVAKVGWGATAAETADLSGPVYVFGNSADRIAVWADCVTCFGDARPTTFPPGKSQVASLAAWTRAAATGPWADLGVGARLLLENPSNAVGVAVYTYPSGSATKEWTDWITFPAQKLPATIAPAAPTAEANADLTLTLSVTGAPGNLEYVWDFADGTAPATTTAPNVTHKWSSGGTYVAKVTARDKTTKQPIAKASSTVAIGGGVKWQLDQFTITQRTCPGTCTEVNFAEFERLAVTPGSGVLYAYPTAVTPSLGSNFPTPGIYLAVSPRGVTTPPLPWAPATNVTWPLGNTFVGQSAGGFAISNTFDWTGSNTSGTVAGAASPIDQVTNDFRFTIQATKSGNTISGTMTMVQRTRPSLAVVFAYTATFRGQVVP